MEHADKCTALREELFPPPADRPDHLNPEMQTAEDHDLEYIPVTRTEIKEALFSTSPLKAPGHSGIPTLALRWVWAAAEDTVFLLLSKCAQVGHHPQIWPRSISIALKKPNKKDYSNPRAYRLIQLLDTLGKVLEKVMARRLTWMAARYGLVTPK